MSLTHYSVRQVDALIVLSTPELDGKALECVANVLGYPVFGIGYGQKSKLQRLSF